MHTSLHRGLLQVSQDPEATMDNRQGQIGEQHDYPQAPPIPTLMEQGQFYLFYMLMVHHKILLEKTFYWGKTLTIKLKTLQ